LAIGILEKLDDFRSKLKEAAAERYELWFTDKQIALIPTVTSKNVHTYVVQYSTEAELKEILEQFSGRKMKMNEILYDKW